MSALPAWASHPTSAWSSLGVVFPALIPELRQFSFVSGVRKGTGRESSLAGTETAQSMGEQPHVCCSTPKIAWSSGSSHFQLLQYSHSWAHLAPASRGLRGGSSEGGLGGALHCQSGRHWCSAERHSWHRGSCAHCMHGPAMCSMHICLLQFTHWPTTG